MQRLLADAPLADCRIIINDTVTLPCHKCVLAARCSPRFWNEILSELNVGSEVRLYSVSADAVRALLCFVYSETLPIAAAPAVLQEVVHLGQTCGMPRLASMAEAALGGSGAALPAGSLVRDLFNLMRAHTHADVRIVSESGVLRAHRAILCARSPWIRTQLLRVAGSGGITAAARRGVVVSISSSDEIVFKQPGAAVSALLEYLYTDAVTVGHGVAEPLLEVATVLQLPRCARLGLDCHPVSR
jgi:hypothetical protein